MRCISHEQRLRAQEFFMRSRALKTSIQADEGILRNIHAAASHLYGKEPLPETVMEIGKGSEHVIYGVGRIALPEGPGLYLAARLKKRPYGVDDHLLWYEMAHFTSAFAEGENTPYFISAISWEMHNEYRSFTAGGILTEDISRGKRQELKNRGRMHVERLGESGTKRFFVDPVYLTADHLDRYVKLLGRGYFRDGIRIELASPVHEI